MIVPDVGSWKMRWQIDKWDADAIDRQEILEPFLAGFAPKRFPRLHRRGRRHQPVFIDRVAPLWVPRPGATPYDSLELDGNLLLNAGIQRLEDLLIGAGGTAFNNANSRIGVGNSNTAAAASQTDLQAAAGAGNRQFQVMDATFPSRSSQTISWRSTMASGEANFAWEEAGVDNGTSAGTTVTAPLLNRKVASLGTKVSGAVWQITATLVIS